jgi:hypothetical protein
MITFVSILEYFHQPDRLLFSVIPDLCGRPGRLAEERIILKEGFPTLRLRRIAGMTHFLRSHNLCADSI